MDLRPMKEWHCEPIQAHRDSRRQVRAMAGSGAKVVGDTLTDHRPG